MRTAKRDENGWVTIKAGEWGNKYLDRAAIADYAIYANRAASSMYPEVHVDQIGDPLEGSQRYTLRFEKFQLPPVNDFWSITLYRGDTLTLAENPIKRYSIGDRTPGLKFDDDGSLTIYVQKDSPGKDKESNWLAHPVRRVQPDGQVLRAPAGHSGRQVQAAAGEPHRVVSRTKSHP